MGLCFGTKALVLGLGFGTKDLDLGLTIIKYKKGHAHCAYVLGNVDKIPDIEQSVKRES